MVAYKLIICHTVLLILLLILLLVSGTGKIPKPRAKDSCDKQRKILSDAYGIISDGSVEYPEDSHCEWLIKAISSEYFITLHFIEMETECSYDHIFVYDGDSYDSSLLGSFSGSTIPSSVTANKGAMLILLYSDTNYVRQGFKAVYSITDCPLNCSGKGQCINHQCLCDALWSGNGCEINLCPDDCGKDEGRGYCDNESKLIKCICKPGYSGKDCSLPDSNKNAGNSWHIVSQDGTGFTERAGHSGVYIPSVDKFYIFGGFAFGKVLGDLLAYEFTSNEWLNINTKPSPSSRWGHAVSLYESNFVMFGGELEDSRLSNELWLFNISNHHWQKFHVDRNSRPPPLTKHSLTLVENKWIYLFGGSFQDGSFSSEMYRISLSDSFSWEKVIPLGGKQSDRRIVGHTAIYYKPSKTIFIYGGVTVDYARFSKLSNRIHAFHIEKRYWTRIHYPEKSNSPLERAFHSAAIVGDYMVVYGGYTHRHSHEEICYDNETHLYHLKCHKWVDTDSIRKDSSGSRNPISQGVFSHAMGVRHGHTLLIAGGYSGVMRASLLAYVLPYSVTAAHLLSNSCMSHKSMESCKANPICGWCTNHGHCLEKKNQKMCGATNFISEHCPGFCATLSNCHSCLIWGEPTGANVISDSKLQDLFPHASCAWCVQAMQCHPVHDPPLVCSLTQNFSNPVPDTIRWWGSNATEITSIKECSSYYFQPGLTSLKFRHPVNWEQPDEVSVVNQTSEDLYFHSEFSREREISGSGVNVAKFIGFLHPLGAKPLSERMSQLQLYMGSGGAHAVLKLSNDTTLHHLEVVANHSSHSYYRSEAHRISGSPIFPNTSQGYKYLVDFTVHLPVTYNDTATMQISWNAFSIQPEVITHQYLEPYKNGSCSIHSNCLACLTDASCGWCEVAKICLNKISSLNVIPNCQEDGESHFLVTQPEDCSLCSDYIYCEHCAKVSNCEWLVEEAHCIRRGRFDDAVRHPDLCPSPCHQRLNCSSCLGDPGRCAWCEATQTCFLFATYTTSYMYGQCREWVDEDRTAPKGITSPGAQCRDCNRHKECSGCLKDLSCGWCGNKDNPTIGVCAQGDFSGPSEGECTLFLEEKHDIPPTELANWSYTSCPDVEECRLGLHDCHLNATCTNTQESYLCKCNDGFKGDGKSTCTRTCSEECINGYCSEAPDYKCICKLGWTGDDCSINCGCHNHSSCVKSVGLCDECQDWTEGMFCEKCKPGSYGDAVTPAGCQKCNCNGHGDSELGYCNSTTGVCYCQDNTIGVNCEKCQPGHYGDPRNGGYCFLECQPRGVITNVLMGKLGSQSKTTYPFDCLWILTVYSVLDMASLLGPMPSTEAVIQLIIHEDIKVPCPHNRVYIYDGLPDFIALGHPNRLLGAFCSLNLNNPISVVATSGYLTVHFKRNDFNQGFNATYKRIEYSKYCTLNKTCRTENCNSELIQTGSYCGKEICPNNCSVMQNQGACDVVYGGNCVCKIEYGGSDCSVLLKPYNLIWTSVFNSELMVEKYAIFPSERMGHSLLAIKNSMNNVNLWIFGGYSPSVGNMNDLFTFESLNRQWKKVDRENSPRGRHYHASAVLKDSFYIYGGLSHDDVLGDFWQFNTTNEIWTQLMTTEQLPPMASCTLTKVDDQNLILIGGYSPKFGFFDKVMNFNIINKSWSSINCTGAQPIGIYGHSSIYHPDTESIYVFGGVTYYVDHVSVSSDLYALHYPSKQWFHLPPDEKVNPLETRPLPRYFHEAVVAKYFMIILGGRSSNTSKEFPQPFAYIFSCNLWIPLNDEDIEVVGEPPRMLVGTSAEILNNDIYVFGGFDGKASGELKKLTIPSDFCNLFSVSRVGCIDHTGCSFCSVHEKGINQTFCYSQNWHSPSSCYNPKGTSEVVRGTSCNSDWIEKRDCQQYSSCTDCVASWPIYLQAKQVCQWCSNCKVGRCIPVGKSCEKENNCNIPRKVISQPSSCPLRVCVASDCEKCQSLRMCMWTRQVLRSSGWGHTLNMKPIYNWTCVQKEIQDAPPFPIESMPPLQCPPQCNQYDNCTSCLESSGGEGGWHECVWSEVLHMCMSPSFELLRCEDASCGPVLQGNSTLCPVPCWHHTQASHCLSHSDCGWCAFSGNLVDGRGLCIKGDIMGPTGGLCRENQVLLLGTELPGNTSKWLSMSEGPPFWTYLVKPIENECANGHHTCDERHEECIDTIEGFECRCKAGYTFEGKQCKPICNQGCVSGTCIQPDMCQCNFGYVGKNCSTPCECNGHSNCAGPDRLNECHECHNNTQGPQCQKCKPFFVGNPVNSGKCMPCHDFCNGHSSICFSSDLISNNGTFSQPINQTIVEILEKLKEGALDNAVCLDCQNYTEGRRCDQCVSGYFKAGESIKDGCRLCECHGHGDMCNPINGENCNCQNNTENDRQCSQKNMKNIMTPCWQLQCSKCKEYFLGAPAHGHQCYRHMFVDKDYCFDPNTQDYCQMKHNALLQGRTVFFAVQPRYMNVDLRIVVDVTEGGIDFYLSAKEDTFVIDVNKSSGIHYISVDKKYGIDIRNELEFPNHLKPKLDKKNKRETVVEDLFHDLFNSSDVLTSTLLQLREAQARGLTTYVTVTESHEFLLIRNLKNRLVITIPQEVHDLQKTRFYMVLRGVGSKNVSLTFGNLFFRQDQTRIDLFVFFSVFFSCFFLFLAICVVIWKVKQAFDVRRARRLHAAEMKHMASRPFGHIITVIDDEPDEYDFLLYSPTNYRKKSKHNKGYYGRDSPKIFDDKFGIRPLAIEPISDGIGAVATILIQLPGGMHSLMKLTLASALITMRSSHHPVGCGLRAAMRRRTSHVNL